MFSSVSSQDLILFVVVELKCMHLYVEMCARMCVKGGSPTPIIK